MLRKFLSIFIVFALVTTLLPVITRADETPSNDTIQNVDPEFTAAPKVGEITSERTANTSTFYLGNGKYQKRIYPTKIHNKNNKTGQWDDISPNLEEKDSSEVTTADTSLVPSFLKQMDNGKYVTYQYGDQSISFSLVKGTDTDGKDYTPNNVEAAYSDKDNRILYNDVFPSINLRDFTFDSQIKEDLIVNQYTGINQFQYKIETSLKATTNDDGSISFVDSNNKEVFSLPKPYMEDSNIDQHKGEGQQSDNVKYSLTPIDGGYQLTLMADADWLKSSDRVYPVYIDPSTSITASSDAFVMSAYPTTNYSSSSSKWDSTENAYVLKVGNYDSTTGTCYGYVNESLSSLANMNITSATFNAYVVHSYYPTTATGLWLDYNTQSLSVGSVTWNTKPTSTNISSVNVAQGKWANFDVTSIVKGWANGSIPNHGFKLHTNGNGQTYWKKISSTTNSSNQPYLSVTYTIPAPNTPTGQVYSNGDGTGYVNLSWNSVPGATGYKVWIYNGKDYQSFDAGNSTTWSSHTKGIWPSSGYLLKTDGSGGELAADPSQVYTNSGGIYQTNKNYWFRVSAVFPQGESDTSSFYKPTIPNLSVPSTPTGSSYSTGNGKGYINLNWQPVTGATGYKVWIFNGQDYQSFDAGNATSWSTQGQKIWPTSDETTAGKYLLHTDKKGDDFVADPSQVYRNSKGSYTTNTNYWFKVSAYNDQGETVNSSFYKPTIPNLAVPAAPTGSTYTNTQGSKTGYVDLQWAPVTGATSYKVWIYNGKDYQSFDAGNSTTWSTQGKGIWPTSGYLLKTDGSGGELAVDPSPVYKSSGGVYPNNTNYWFRVSAVDGNGETVYSNPFRPTFGDGSIPSNEENLLGLEDYFTYGTHQMGNANVSVNVITGNMNMGIKDFSLYTQGTIDFDFTRYYNSLSSESSSLGTGWTFTGNESLIKGDTSDDIYYFDEDGTSHQFAYNATDGTYTSPKGKYLTLTKQTVDGTAGYQLTDTNGFTKLFEASPDKTNAFRLYAYQDKNQNTIRFKYTGSQLTEIAQVDNSGANIGKSITLSYDNGLISKVSYNDQWIEYTYTNGELTGTVTHANGTTNTLSNSFTYNEDDQMSGYTDAKGHDNTFNNDGNTITVIAPQSSDSSKDVTTTYTFDYKNNNYTATNSTGDVTTYKRDTKNNTFAVADTTNPDGTSNSVVYDDNYNVLSSTDESGNTESNVYDSQGNLTQNTDKEGNVTKYAYDDNNLLTTKTDPVGNVTKYSYDDHGNLLQTQVGDEVTQYQFDSYGRQIKETDPNNTVTETTYTDHTVTEKDAQGNTTSSTYDDNGNITSETDSAGRTTSYEYDPLNTDVKTSITDGNGNKTSYTYDSNGNLLTLTDALGRQKSYTYNGNDQISSAVLPRDGQDTITLKYQYDSNGNLQMLTQNSGIAESYSYDQNNQLQTVTVNQDGKDNLKISNNYNEVGSLTSTQLTDLLNNKVLIDKEYKYDDNDQTLLKQFNIGDFFQINYDYYDDHSVQDDTLQYTDASQPIVVKNNYTYTTEGKPDTLGTIVNNESLFQFGYSYDLTNRINTLNANNGLFQQLTTTDSTNHIQSIQYVKGTDSNPSSQFSYEYDGSGNITKESTSKGDTSYTYDGSNQLTKEVLPDGTTNSYEYDSVGNRISSTANGMNNTYTYTEGNQIKTKNGINFVYDMDGNLIQDDHYKYEYNALGQQTKVTTLSGDVVAQYEYDENGLRTKKIAGSQTNEYFYKNNNLSLEVIRDNGAITQYRYYQWGNNGKPLGFIVCEQNDSGQWISNQYFYWTNQRGDVISIIDKDGNEVGSYTYDSFGDVLTENGTLAKENNIRYAGYYYDSETKNYYLKARYYNPDNGDFLSLDPKLEDTSNRLVQNGYNYANNNPINNIDPNGTFGYGILIFSYDIPYIGEVALAATGVVLLGGAAWSAGSWLARKVRAIFASDGTPRNNQAQNKQVDSIAKKHKLSKKERRILHDAISHRNYPYKEIDEIAKEIKNGTW